MDKETALMTYKDIDVFESDIDVLCDEYISRLDSPDMVYKPMGFNGLLDYIYKRLIKNLISATDKEITKRNDYELLTDIFFNIYIPLCYKYSITPTVIQFCSTLVRIDHGNITDVRSGYYRKDGRKVNHNAQLLVKKWFDVCESGLVNNVVQTNGIGSIFLLKALYRYTETAPVEIPQQLPEHETAEQISARHASALLPEKPQQID